MGNARLKRDMLERGLIPDQHINRKVTPVALRKRLTSWVGLCETAFESHEASPAAIRARGTPVAGESFSRQARAWLQVLLRTSGT
jgi:hypothetical protein